MESRKLRLKVCAVLLALAPFIVGCEQLQGTGVKQQSTAQQAQDGADASINVVSGPGNGGKYSSAGYVDPEAPPDDGPLAPDYGPESLVTVGAGQGLTLNRRPGGGSDYFIVLGDITQTQTSGVDGGLTQTPSGTATGGSMVQEPKSSAAVPITVSAAPGSSAQGGSTAAALEGSTGQQSSANQATIDYLQMKLKANENQLLQAMKAIEELKKAQGPLPGVPTTQPATEPMSLEGSGG